MSQMQNRVYRGDGRIEWVCEHGVGHPIQGIMDKISWNTVWQSWMGIHGCDGCCSHWHEEDLIDDELS